MALSRAETRPCLALGANLGTSQRTFQGKVLLVVLAGCERRENKLLKGKFALDLKEKSVFLTPLLLLQPKVLGSWSDRSGGGWFGVKKGVCFFFGGMDWADASSVVWV